jgi:hypothetical protein
MLSVGAETGSFGAMGCIGARLVEQPDAATRIAAMAAGPNRLRM